MLDRRMITNAEIRREIESTRDGRGFARPKAELKKQILTVVEERRRAGETMEQIAAELGLAKSSLDRWRRQASAGRRKRLVRVKVRDTSSALVLRGPCGLTIEGLGIDDLAELVRRLQ